MLNQSNISAYLTADTLFWLECYQSKQKELPWPRKIWEQRKYIRSWVCQRWIREKASLPGSQWWTSLILSQIHQSHKHTVRINTKTHQQVQEQINPFVIKRPCSTACMQRSQKTNVSVYQSTPALLSTETSDSFKGILPRNDFWSFS